ncbi:hypothetical protein BJY52DRAFT_1224620 [Lactarius psammicola]|nr:hypothetical protein BJY52DRAFT_1224620 [Lactarius psammicola]
MWKYQSCTHPRWAWSRCELEDPRSPDPTTLAIGNDHYNQYQYSIRAKHKVIHFLITHGANVGARDSQSQTPFGLAFASGCYEIAQFLLEHLTKGDSSDDIPSPLHSHSRANCKGHEEGGGWVGKGSTSMTHELMLSLYADRFVRRCFVESGYTGYTDES